MKKNEVKELMEGFLDYLDEMEDADEYEITPDDEYCEMSMSILPGSMNCDYSKEDLDPVYRKRIFLSQIFNLGKLMYRNGILDEDELDIVFLAVSRHLKKSIPDAHYFAVRRQEYKIAIATPIYIPNAPEVIGEALGIIPDIFIEVSGPQSTVLIIDCEKEWLRKEFLKIGEDEWLL